MDNNQRREEVENIINNHVIWSMGAGLIPIPLADFFAVSAVQLDMIRQLSSIYELDFKESEGKALISSLSSAGLSQLGARSAIKFIPGLGQVVGGVAMSIFSGASTYALGEVFAKHFETGGTFLDFDSSRLRKVYEKKFEKGKKVARDLKDKENKKENPEDTAKAEAAEKARKEALEKARQEAIQKAQLEAEERAKKVIEEAKKKAEELAKQQSAEIAKKAAEQAKKEAELKSKEAELRSKSPKDPLVQLHKLGELHKAGILSEEEFEEMKRKVIDAFGL